ncbi:MAG: hypothetical protein K2O53_00710, partial [Bacteroidales bacterium]|nr:hypothetical protein [Bacteroidales bacterium]
MNTKIRIRCENTGLSKEYPRGVTLKEIAEDQQIKLQDDILGATVNNRVRELDYDLYNPKTVRFFDIHAVEGYRMYMRSLIFVLGKAVKDCYPQLSLRVEHSLPIGFYCELDGLDKLGDKAQAETDSNGHRALPLSLVATLKQRMQAIIQANLPFEHEEIPSQDAVTLYRERHYP